ncbi:MAG: hypothetical protein H6551_04355 [Chitinophagales bacterium]|nr:hypothetical protein [Chitinophagaceae bacterium]MCB9064356.1 hypothetical protein [Chitinophagales bacterium]
MKFRILVITVSASLFALSTYAQDQLTKKNGDVLEVKVKEVSARTISYTKADNPNGPAYVISRNEVASIVYENGSEDVFSEVEQRKVSTPKNVKYGNNIIGLAPLQITRGIGVGLTYERVIDKNNILSFYLPVTVAFTGFNDPVTGTGVVESRPAYYFMPGLKFYPTGGKGIVRYGVGPNLVLALSEDYRNELIYDNMGNIVGQDIGWRSRTTFGIMVTNSLNINPTSHLHLGLELGVGFSYINKLAGVSTDPIGLAQFGFKVGYRF